MTCHVVVIDDSCRFPLHVWRYVGRALGFGIGEVTTNGTRLDDPLHERWIETAPSYLSSDDGQLRLWWVRADGNWRTGLNLVLDAARGARFLALIDIHGEAGSSYRYTDVCNYLEGVAHGKDFRIISSYHPGSGGSLQSATRLVVPKSLETLREIAHEVRRSSTQIPGAADADTAAVSAPTAVAQSRVPQGAAAPRVRHVLVTGAGFEIRSPRGGFGMPPTRVTLEQMGTPFYLVDGSTSDGDLGIMLQPQRVGFPVPVNRQRVKPSALNEDLDSYWNHLLEEVVVDAVLKAGDRPAVPLSDRDDLALGVLRRERQMREAFRRALLLHDWGHMNQSVAAANLSWHTWLTTNYTRFADRAIGMLPAAQAADGVPWRIIATATDARLLAREDAGGHSHARFLFKLHGDIAHIESMAIAGHDKAPYSPLSMPVDDLYEIYAAAQRFLIDSLDDRGIVWHVVGHRLLDQRLRELLRHVQRHVRARWQVFVVVNPLPEDALKWLQEELGSPQHDREVLACRQHASAYLAALDHRGLPDDDDVRVVAAAVEVLGNSP